MESLPQTLTHSTTSRASRGTQDDEGVNRFSLIFANFFANLEEEPEASCLQTCWSLSVVNTKVSRISITKGIPSDHPLSDKPPRMSYSHARLSSAYYTVRDFKNQEQPWSRQSVQNKVLLPFLAFVVIELGKIDCTFGCVEMSKPHQALSVVVSFK